jgi:hypothetical protein
MLDKAKKFRGAARPAASDFGLCSRAARRCHVAASRYTEGRGVRIDKPPVLSAIFEKLSNQPARQTAELLSLREAVGAYDLVQCDQERVSAVTVSSHAVVADAELLKVLS